jgi:hypothetical protein
VLLGRPLLMAASACGGASLRSATTPLTCLILCARLFYLIWPASPRSLISFSATGGDTPPLPHQLGTANGSQVGCQPQNPDNLRYFL